MEAAAESASKASSPAAPIAAPLVDLKLKFPILQLDTFLTDAEGPDAGGSTPCLLAVSNGYGADVYELNVDDVDAATANSARTRAGFLCSSRHSRSATDSNEVSDGAVTDAVGQTNEEERAAADGEAEGKDGKPMPKAVNGAAAAEESAQSNKLVRHVRVGVAPAVSSLSSGTASDGEDEVELVLATVTEDKLLRLDRLEPLEPAPAANAAPETIYTRTLIKKAAYISLEADGSVLVSDKVGDLFEYPSPRALSAANAEQARAPRPDATALAGDPSLNPDARLLVGHVSTLTAHVLASTPAPAAAAAQQADEKVQHRWLVSADRDEHVRISRYPDTHVVHRFLHGHERFVGALQVVAPPSSAAAHRHQAGASIQPTVLLSAGGDDHVFIWDLEAATASDEEASAATAAPARPSSDFLLAKVEIAPTVKPHRRVRAPMRRLPPGRHQAAPAAGASPEGEPANATEADAFDIPAPNHVLPLGQGICVTKIEVVCSPTPDGKRMVVFLSQGCSALFAFDLDEAIEGRASVRVFPTAAPVLDFVLLPSSSRNAGCDVLVSTDPAWEQRLDGGRAYDPPKLQPVSRSHKKRLEKEDEQEGAEGIQVTEASAAEGFSIEDLKKMRENGLVVVAFDAEGQVSKL